MGCGIEIGLDFLGDSDFFGGGSFKAMALRTLSAFSTGAIGGGADFLTGGGESSKLEPRIKLQQLMIGLLK